MSSSAIKGLPDLIAFLKNSSISFGKIMIFVSLINEPLLLSLLIILSPKFLVNNGLNKLFSSIAKSNSPLGLMLILAAKGLFSFLVN